MVRTLARPKKTTSIAISPNDLQAAKLKSVNDRFERCKQVLDMIHEDGDDPLLLLWRLARHPDADVRLRVDCAKEVAAYLHSKQSNVKVTGDASQPVSFNVTWDTPPTDSERVALTTVMGQTSLYDGHGIEDGEVIDVDE